MSNLKSSKVERKTRSRIETREAGCAALTGSEWRDIATEPPAFDLPVIVYQPNWKGQPVTLAVYVCLDSSGHKFGFDIQTPELHRRDFRYSVTHWRPLPAPPNIAI